VKFLIYDGTTQRTCLRLMGRRVLVALMMEGKFSGEGLHSMDADDDMLAAMARELVERGGVGDSADAVWEELCKTGQPISHQRLPPRRFRPSWERHHFADEALKEATQDQLASADDTGCTADLTVASADALTKDITDPRKTP
jgi:hypothetical protein